MEIDGPHYRIYGYHADALVVDSTRYVDALHATEMIEHARTLTENAIDLQLGEVTYTDLFYCDGTEVQLVGTWVVEPGATSAAWHADGWQGRPCPSKEKSLRYLHSLGRPI